MKIIRWLLSHTFLILLIVAVIYCYMFWGNLTGEDTPAGKAIAYLSDEFVEVESFVEAVKSKQAELASERSSAEKPVALTETGTSTEQRAVVQQPVNISYSHNQKPVEQSAMAVNNTGAGAQATAGAANRMMPAATAPAAAMNRTSEKFISPEIEEQLSNVDEHGKAIDPSQTGNSVKESWITARKSFYQRDYDKSIQSYQDVIDNTEDNFDAYGELGNVYFNQGKKREAASAYFEAAAILIKKGQVNRAQSLMGLLRQLDEAKANELKTLIDSARS
ncbi:MAG: tetratricopeptide repeat protein [Gammaproteobacteria bacterium]|nr:tetratricopeptide repeat protein [Gammaproteobacteria bacterium]MBT8134397.1 tetratricopeptide repeat protein [Gammaproteobacteria bacterium]NNJ48913.1 tetratricopeptide repeat protein [Gammaproteobacteria bacterium]